LQLDIALGSTQSLIPRDCQNGDPYRIKRRTLKVRISPASVAFSVLLGFLVALPSFGIDMSLPALTAMGASFGVAPSRVGLMMGGFIIGFAVAPSSMARLRTDMVASPS
jgi:hypothetical protein